LLEEEGATADKGSLVQSAEDDGSMLQDKATGAEVHNVVHAESQGLAMTTGQAGTTAVDKAFVEQWMHEHPDKFSHLAKWLKSGGLLQAGIDEKERLVRSAGDGGSMVQDEVEEKMTEMRADAVKKQDKKESCKTDACTVGNCNAVENDGQGDAMENSFTDKGLELCEAGTIFVCEKDDQTYQYAGSGTTCAFEKEVCDNTDWTAYWEGSPDAC